MSSLRDRLQSALGDNYRIERELGGGGMSHVYVAEEVRLKRKVVIKLLPPEATAAVHADRFAREIEVAASLSHPHIVPLLAAGEADGLLWYAMPFIEGESLAERLTRQGPLPVADVVRIMRDVADALGEAHARGIVHRDIKPANVLLRGRHALVADFGVAKALAAAGTQPGDANAALTGMGIALGTPSYMAPEQAAADPATDYRADIYSLGVVAYEALSGRLPFDRGTPQEMIVAHIATPPLDIRVAAPSVTQDVAEAVMRCLAKRPSDRWKNADALVAWCEQRGTPSGGASVDPAVTSAHRMLNQWSSRRIVSLYPLVAVAAVSVAFGLTQVVGLPHWIWWLAAALAIIGLPVMWNAARHERRRATATLTGLDLDPSGGTAPWRSGKRAVQFGWAAAALVVLLGGGYLASRAAGIGPWKTLMSAGTLAMGDRILLAEFANTTSDSTLGGAVVEALRVDLAQSRSIRLLDARVIRAAMIRAGYPPDSTRLIGAVAREVAQRENAKIVLTGTIAAVGTGYVLTASLIDPAADSALRDVRENASGPEDLIPAINRLSNKVREYVGESLRTIRSSEPLAQVTTASLPALRLYSEANTAGARSDWGRAAELLEQAVALDTAFAMAWRKLAVAYNNLSIRPEDAREAIETAMRHLDRLPPLERHLTEGSFYGRNDSDRPKAIVAYRAVLAIQPDEPAATNNLGMMLNADGKFAEAAELLGAAVERGSAPFSTFTNMMFSAVAMGDTARADSLNRIYLRQTGDTAQALRLSLQAALAQRKVAVIDSLAEQLERMGVSAQGDLDLSQARLTTTVLRGRLADARAIAEGLADFFEANDNPGEAIDLRLSLAYTRAAALDQAGAAVTEMEAALKRYPLDSIAAVDRPYFTIGEVYAFAGRTADVRRARAEWDRTRPADMDRTDGRKWWDMLEAISERRWAAVAAMATALHAKQPCHPCGAYYIATAWDRAGNADSAIVWYTTAVTKMDSENGAEDPVFLPIGLLRLGEMQADRGERDKAREYLQRFIDLWRGADAELQPMVTRAKTRLAEVTAEP